MFARTHAPGHARDHDRRRAHLRLYVNYHMRTERRQNSQQRRLHRHRTKNTNTSPTSSCVCAHRACARALASKTPRHHNHLRCRLHHRPRRQPRLHRRTRNNRHRKVNSQQSLCIIKHDYLHTPSLWSRAHNAQESLICTSPLIARPSCTHITDITQKSSLILRPSSITNQH